MSEEIKEIPLKERIEKLLESGWVNEFNYLENQLQEARYLVVILQQKVKQLENIRKEAIKATKDVKQFVYDELVDRNVSGATETHCKIMDLLNILNKGSNKE